MKFGAVIVGGGKGERLGATLPKCLLPIDGIPILLLSVYPFQLISDISAISLVVPHDWEDEVRGFVELYELTRVTAVVPGGERRQDSVQNGIRALPVEVDRVIIHDGARPLTKVDLIKDTIEALRHFAAVTTALPISDTIHRWEDGFAEQGPDRANLWGAQTPQGFQRTLLTEAYKLSILEQIAFTDEVSLVRKAHGIHAKLVKGDPCNVKITFPEDIALFAAQLSARAKNVGGYLV